jgi:hypothetical protein
VTGKIIVGVAIALLAGGTAPWWWSIFFPKPPVKQIPPECSQDNLRAELVRAGPDKAIVVKTKARMMREKFRLQQFDCVADLAAVLLENDEDNGHGLYFAGEVWRVKAAQDSKHSALCRDRMREHFFRYFASLRGLAANECDGDGTKCYEREKGYCAGRTAWISHLMAIDFYQQARETQDVSTKLDRLQSASQFLKNRS